MPDLNLLKRPFELPDEQTKQKLFGLLLEHKGEPMSKVARLIKLPTETVKELMDDPQMIWEFHVYKLNNLKLIIDGALHEEMVEIVTDKEADPRARVAAYKELVKVAGYAQSQPLVNLNFNEYGRKKLKSINGKD